MNVCVNEVKYPEETNVIDDVVEKGEYETIWIEEVVEIHGEDC